MLQFLRDNQHADKIILQTLRRTYTGFYVFRIYLDACVTGLGGCFNNLVFAFPNPKGFMTYNIAQLEMVSVVVALKVWGHGQ